MEQKRERWLDIAKGIGIILVLIDHSQSFMSDYVSWFHLSIFFVLSGYLFKPLSNWKEFKGWAVKRTLSLMIPYISFMAIITFYRYVVEIVNGNHSISWFIKDIARNIFGGRFIGGFYAPFWFITCLLVTQITFALVLLLLKSNKKQFTLILVLYLIAHIEAWLTHFKGIQFYIPLALDITLISLTYYSVGYYFKKFIKNIPITLTALAVTLSSLIVFFHSKGYLNFKYELKYIQYTNLILDFLIPILFTLAVLGICQQIERSKYITNPLASIGVLSLPIMYLHFPLNLVIKNYVLYGSLIFIGLGLLAPYIVSKLVFTRFAVTRTLFLGDFKKVTKPSIKAESRAAV